MARIPVFRRTQTIPGPGSIPTPRATAAAFGGGMGRALEIGGRKVGELGLAVLEKKNKELSDLYVSKTTSETRAAFTRRAIELRKETDGDIAPLLDQEMRLHHKVLQEQAPTPEAAARVQLATQQMFGTMRARAIVQDEQFRTQKLIFQSEESHRNNRATSYDDFGQLGVLLENSRAEINNLDLSEQDKIELITKRKFELGHDALTGLIDRDRAGAEQALRLLNGDKELTKDFLDTKQRQQLVRYAERTIRSLDAEADRDIIRAERLRSQNQRDIRNGMMDKFLDDSLSMEDIRTSGGDADTKNFFRNLMIKEAEGPKPPPASERAEAYADLVEAIDAADPEDIDSMDQAILWNVENRLITPGEGRVLSNRLNEPITESRKRLEKVVKTQLTKTNTLTGVDDPKGDELYLQAMAEVDRLERDAREKEIPEFALYDPNSEHYILPKLQKYRRTPAQIINDLSKELIPVDVNADDTDEGIVDSIIRGLGFGE